MQWIASDFAFINIVYSRGLSLRLEGWKQGYLDFISKLHNFEDEPDEIVDGNMVA